MLRKITNGYVIQVFDPETQEWVSQEFIAGDEIEYEDENGKPVEPFDEHAYLPFSMKQPGEI